MREKDDIILSLTCECRHDFDVSIGSVKQEAFRFVCPACGEEDGLSEEDIKTLRGGHARSSTPLRDILLEKREL